MGINLFFFICKEFKKCDSLWFFCRIEGYVYVRLREGGLTI